MICTLLAKGLQDLGMLLGCDAVFVLQYSQHSAEGDGAVEGIALVVQRLAAALLAIHEDDDIGDY